MPSSDDARQGSVKLDDADKSISQMHGFDLNLQVSPCLLQMMLHRAQANKSLLVIHSWGAWLQSWWADDSWPQQPLIDKDKGVDKHKKVDVNVESCIPGACLHKSPAQTAKPLSVIAVLKIARWPTDVISYGCFPRS